MHDPEAFWVGAIIFLAIYFVPSIVAFVRQHPNRWLILIVNSAFGFTFIGWLVPLVWALNAVHKPVDGGARGGESGLNIFANDTTNIRLVGAPRIEPSLPRLTETQPKQSISEAIAEIEKLELLKRSGDLTEAEFDKLKRSILERL